MACMETQNAMQAAVREAGGQSALARKLTDFGVLDIHGKPMKFAQGHVWMWLKRGYPPAEVCLPIESIVDAKVTRHDLRPDVFSAQRAS